MVFDCHPAFELMHRQIWSGINLIERVVRHCYCWIWILWELFRGLFFAKIIYKKLNKGITTVTNAWILLLTESLSNLSTNKVPSVVWLEFSGRWITAIFPVPLANQQNSPPFRFHEIKFCCTNASFQSGSIQRGQYDQQFRDSRLYK